MTSFWKEWYGLQLLVFLQVSSWKKFIPTNQVLVSDLQGILLDEADGVNRTQQPVLPAGFQPPKIVVSSWNRMVGYLTSRL